MVNNVTPSNVKITMPDEIVDIKNNQNGVRRVKTNVKLIRPRNVAERKLAQFVGI